MVLQIILADILLVTRNTTQLVKYPRVLSVKPSNKVYLSHYRTAPLAQFYRKHFREWCV